MGNGLHVGQNDEQICKKLNHGEHKFGIRPICIVKSGRINKLEAVAFVFPVHELNLLGHRAEIFEKNEG